MTIRERIKSSEGKQENALKKSIRMAFIRVLCGYLGGTVIGLILRMLIYG